MVIVLFGVTGSGKTTIGRLLAEDLGWRFVDADDHHSSTNVEKMAAGIPLDDEDRWEWLGRLRELIEEAVQSKQNIILACSALKTIYREQLFASGGVKFVLLKADLDTIQQRLTDRKGHFMDPNLLQSQFDILEAEDLVDLVVDGSKRPDTCLTAIRNSIQVPA